MQIICVPQCSRKPRRGSGTQSLAEGETEEEWEPRITQCVVSVAFIVFINKAQLATREGRFKNLSAYIIVYIIIVIIIAYYDDEAGAIHFTKDRFTSFFTRLSRKPTKKESEQDSERARGREKLSDFFIILIFIYILSILHNARVTTEIVGWQFINT